MQGEKQSRGKRGLVRGVRQKLDVDWLGARASCRGEAEVGRGERSGIREGSSMRTGACAAG